MHWLSTLLTDYLFLVCVHSQVVSLNCPIFCPEVPAIYHCVITSERLTLTVTGNFGGVTIYDQNDDIGTLKPFGSSFTANKTGTTSFSLIFTAEVKFNNSASVICTDQIDSNTNTNTRQCSIDLEGKINSTSIITMSLSTGPPTTTPGPLSYSAISSTAVNISWLPSSEECLDYYRVTVTNQSTNHQEIFNTTSTSLTISDRLEGVQYSYTVAVVDRANRSGPQSSGIVPDHVMGLQATVNLPDDLSQTNETVNITVTWTV